MTYHVDLEDLRVVFSVIPIEDPEVRDCPCGCEGSMMFGRDERALWVGTTATQGEDGPVGVIGLSTKGALDEFVQTMLQMAERRNVDPDLAASVTGRLIELFHADPKRTPTGG